VPFGPFAAPHAAFFPAVALVSWRSRYRSLQVIAVIAVVLFLPLVLGEPPLAGILNRAADVAMAAWLIAFATRREPGFGS
jgi:hypothetical protein